MRSARTSQRDAQASESEASPARPSKTQLKKEMSALQELGERLLELGKDRLERLGLPDNLLEAVREARKINSHEGRRRQLQFIGRLMRTIDPEPIRALFAAIDGESRSEIDRLHRLERLRDAVIADESALQKVLLRYPGADLQRLRQLRRNALREQAENRPPRAFREIFQLLRSLDEAPTQTQPGVPAPVPEPGEDHEL